jgi:hypothetical protein
VLSDTLLRQHGEFIFTRSVASGTNTNPWMSEAHDKLVMRITHSDEATGEFRAESA